MGDITCTGTSILVLRERKAFCFWSSERKKTVSICIPTFFFPRICLCPPIALFVPSDTNSYTLFSSRTDGSIDLFVTQGSELPGRGAKVEA